MRPLLEVRDLRKTYEDRQMSRGGGSANIAALDGVSLSVNAGEIVAVVGESGGGKSTLARCILRLIEASSGEIRFNQTNLLALGESELRRQRKDFQMVFQDPSSSLSPRMSVGQILSEPLKIHQIVPAAARRDRVAELLQRVGLPSDSADRFPHEFSGGQRQRIAIARALATEPRLLVADEPVSALDVSVRAGILNLLSEQRKEWGLAVLLIAHDLAAVEQVADRVAVLYRGRIVESGTTRELFSAPLHPYSVIMLASAPVADPTRKSSRMEMSAWSSNTAEPHRGCRFHSRCPIVQERCRVEDPILTAIGAGHSVACHHPGELQSVPVES